MWVSLRQDTVASSGWLSAVLAVTQTCTKNSALMKRASRAWHSRWRRPCPALLATLRMYVEPCTASQPLACSTVRVKG